MPGNPALLPWKFPPPTKKSSTQTIPRKILPENFFLAENTPRKIYCEQLRLKIFLSILPIEKDFDFWLFSRSCLKSPLYGVFFPGNPPSGEFHRGRKKFSSAENLPSPMKYSNSAENFPRNISACKIESEKRKKDKKIILYRNSGKLQM